MAYLLLEDGTKYYGEIFGSPQSIVGEVVFNTGMTGYEGVITDPSYHGQIVVMTYPLIGNYGIRCEDTESDGPKIKALIVRELCDIHSNWAAEEGLNDYLIRHNICGLQGVDTRSITCKIRDGGTLRGKIVLEESDTDLSEIKNYQVKNPVLNVTTKSAYKLNGGDKYSIAVIDYGIKKSILNSLVKREYTITVFPAVTDAQAIIDYKPDGILLSNGPGNPADNIFQIEQIKKLIGFRPIFAICLGHQMLALASGGQTEKLKYGHRGCNHPVKDLKTDRVYITSQNHGYSVIPSTMKNATNSHINWHDNTCEGLRYNDSLSLSVQFHPEAGPGPTDTGYLFDEFEENMANFKL